MDWERATSASTRDQTGLTPDESIGFLFQPDSLLSAHYFGTLRRKTFLEPEKRLMLALLEDAIHCFQDNLLTQNVRSRRLFEEAEEWIVEADGDWVFSFENICEALGLVTQSSVRTERRLNCFTPKYLASSPSQITKDEKNFEI